MLTDELIASAKPRDKQFKLSDGCGLFLHVMPTGSKLWRFRFWIGGKEQLFAIGSYPQVGIEAARAAATKARELAKKGVNPAHMRQDEKQENIEKSKARTASRRNVLRKIEKDSKTLSDLRFSAGVSPEERLARIEENHDNMQTILINLINFASARSDEDERRYVVMSNRIESLTKKVRDLEEQLASGQKERK